MQLLLNSFKRILSRRDCPAIMVSDNGGVFGANETQNFASDHGINWKFNLDCAPLVWRQVLKYVVKRLTIRRN